MTGFTHFNREGDPHMVDVSAKDVTSRRAVCCRKDHHGTGNAGDDP